MGTHALIATKQANGDYKVIYCHYDGDPSHTGKILTDSYSSPDLAQQLIDGGDIQGFSREGIVSPLVSGGAAKTVSGERLMNLKPYCKFVYVFHGQVWHCHTR